MSQTNGQPRVVVTGMGAVTPLGLDVASTWQAMLAGRSGVAPITHFDPSRLTTRIAAEVKNFDPSAVLERKDQRRNDLYVQYALVAARAAMDQAGLPARLEGELAERTGVIVGTGIGGVRTLADQILLMGEKGPDRMSPFLIPMAISNLAAGVIAIHFGPQGPNFSVVSACATGGHSIGEAWETIRRGDADVMIAGGAEATGHESMVAGFAAMRALSTRNDEPERASRPFDTGRDGFVIGEGAGVVVLELLAHASARGVEPLAEMVGYGATGDASHITLPAPGGAGAVRAIRRALEKAGLGVDDVTMVNAHATSTPEGDPRELEAIRTLFGERAGAGQRDRQQEHARAHPRRRRRDRSHRHDHEPPDRADPTDHQPRGSRPAGRGPGPDAERGPPARGGRGGFQFLRLRGPEQRPGNPALGRVRARQMSDRHDEPTNPLAGGGTGPEGPVDGPAVSPETASLLSLIDRLGSLLERSDLEELEVEAGETGIVLRKSVAPVPAAGAGIPAGAQTAGATGAAPTEPVPASTLKTVKAPLTGIFYAASSPGSPPYVTVGQRIAVGHVIGLIEAMKLFNEIKSDQAGTVVRVVAESGKLVKAKQPLIEVEP